MSLSYRDRAILTPREHEIHGLVRRGFSSRVIAEQLGISLKVVERLRSLAADKERAAAVLRTG